MKYKIEKNTVQETLIIPLYSRKLCTELYPTLYRDETAVCLIEQIDYDFSQAEKKFPQPDAAVRCAGGSHAAVRSCVGGAGVSENAPMRGGGQSGLRAG